MQCKTQTKVPELRGAELLSGSIFPFHKILLPQIDSARRFFKKSLKALQTYF